MGDPAWDALQAKLAALGNGAGAPKATGPTASNALGGNFVDGKAPMVYWGQANIVQSNTRGMTDSREQALSELGINHKRPFDNTMSLQNAVADWYKWSDSERSAFGQRLYKLGLVSDPNDLYSQSGVFAMWQNAVQTASNFYTFANRKVTPWQAIDLMAPGGTKASTTRTSTSFNIPTVEDAHAATRSVFQSLVGRDPNDEELNRYASMMTAYAQKHPTVTKQTTDAHGNQTSTSSGGYSQSGVTDMLGQQAKADPEYGAYQAATTYFNALMQAVGTNNHG